LSPSPAAALLIEAAMKLTDSRPPIVVIDSMERLHGLQSSFRGEGGERGGVAPITQSCLDKCTLIRRGATRLGSEEPPDWEPISLFYDVEDYM
jgi:hypothetical protein